MNTNALRQKILDLAIHGKLVKQDPADESAAILLEKIRAEKEKKIASGELKRGKNDSYIFFGDDNRHYEKFSDGRVKDIEDEIPFAVPEGWTWCRLGEIGQIISGTSYQKNDIISKGTLRILRGGNIQNNALILKNDDIFIQNKYIDIRKNVILGDIIIVASTGSTNSIGKPAFIDKDYTYTQIGAFLRIIRMILLPISKYINLIFQSEYYTNYIQNNIKGTNINNIKAEHLQRMVLPLPPLSEQQRIVAKIETIFAHIDLLEQNKADLQTAVKQAKSKILDLAIRGKLVPQDPADEPASVMLKKLRAEKEAKIAAGEIKRGKNDSYIYKNSTDNCYYEKFEGVEEQIEIPFDLPEGWCWQKIPSICEINPKNKLDNTLEISFVPMTLIDSEFNNNFTYELQRWETVKSGFSHFADNDIGIAKITPCFENRKSVIFKNLKNKYGAGTTELHILRTNNEYIFNEYVFWFIKTDTFIKEGINNFTGAVGQQRIGKEFIAETLIPIPPLNEQVKICRTINKLMKKLDEISLNVV
ncbi:MULTISPECIES: restriction endonuclease subunit S [unclassified Treponema]|uniref:restriction endonuclease subunit S n=1 Tax=unclassified Treponema TaxID=2638727 RepID=UPI0020A27EE9|nr:MULTISPECIES: restriction endonuclease subunit S [unclassified Treponema]UTC66463.1 restriction endonuclease subunit S [Treponema sp. OMZ 789]UTC69195.1 restriction endonuclease subunit S [Treponema sp. OMZ 790]UTC71908.1 restriction endonuclease subunit S [Treponema sp. OMZ 791]